MQELGATEGWTVDDSPLISWLFLLLLLLNNQFLVSIIKENYIKPNFSHSPQNLIFPYYGPLPKNTPHWATESYNTCVKGASIHK